MESGGKQDRWLLTYADLITLLMVFFVVLYAISEADKEKFLQLKVSMHRAFGSEPTKGEGLEVQPVGGTGLLEAFASPAPITDGEGSTGDALVASRIPTSVTPGPPPAESGLLEQLRQVILPLATAQGVADNVNIYSTTEGVIISLSGNLLFDSGKAELKPEGVAFLHVLAEVVHPLPNRLRVEGHTDSVAISTPLYPSNWELASARAIITARYLTEQEKLAPGRVGAAAYGEFRPVADNDKREGRLRNRRVDILVLNVGKAEEDWQR